MLLADYGKPWYFALPQPKVCPSPEYRASGINDFYKEQE